MLEGRNGTCLGENSLQGRPEVSQEKFTYKHPELHEKMSAMELGLVKLKQRANFTEEDIDHEEIKTVVNNEIYISRKSHKTDEELEQELEGDLKDIKEQMQE